MRSDEERVVVVEDEVMQGLKHVVGARAKSKYRPTLQGVYVDAAAGLAVAADGKRMHSSPVSGIEDGIWDMDLGKNGVVMLTPIDGKYPLKTDALEKTNPAVPDVDTFDIIVGAEDMRAVFSRMSGPVRVRIRSNMQAIEFFGNTRRPQTRAYALVMPFRYQVEFDKTLVWRPWGDVSPDLPMDEEEG